jgi:hypothetical protein
MKRGIHLLSGAIVATAAMVAPLSGQAATPLASGTPLIRASYAPKGPPPSPFIVVVQGKAFTPAGTAEVYVLGPSGLLAHDAVTVSGRGYIVDRTSVQCSFVPLAVLALDDATKQWSNLSTLPAACPG